MAREYLKQSDILKARAKDIRRNIPADAPEVIVLRLRSRAYTLESISRELRATGKYLENYYNHH